VSLDDLGADEQPETGAGHAASRLRAIAALEHPLLLRRRDTDAAVANRDARLGAIDAYVDVDIPSVRRVLDRVADQVLQHPLDAMLIEIGHDRVGRRGVAKRMALRQDLHLVDGAGDDLP